MSSQMESEDGLLRAIELLVQSLRCTLGKAKESLKKADEYIFDFGDVSMESEVNERVESPDRVQNIASLCFVLSGKDKNESDDL
ncbi:hypothetical protein BIW11_03172 [Tropilaelaps mercedesae]|uniref:Uncharacterized protein n=1 Tax=Tropilaelaps mercedesae TaxID=418985 RepID=A0A1V9XR27_9ACAR|nr:hypothetical protein BIW11_03172 [Tropilaelaps mercedesae]